MDDEGVAGVGDSPEQETGLVWKESRIRTQNARLCVPQSPS